MQYILGKPATHARADAFAKLEFYRRRVMGGCLRGGGAYKLLREQKRRKKRHESKKGQAERRENEIDIEVTSLSRLSRAIQRAEERRRPTIPWEEYLWVFKG